MVAYGKLRASLLRRAKAEIRKIQSKVSKEITAKARHEKNLKTRDATAARRQIKIWAEQKRNQLAELLSPARSKDAKRAFVAQFQNANPEQLVKRTLLKNAKVLKTRAMGDFRIS